MKIRCRFCGYEIQEKAFLKHLKRCEHKIELPLGIVTPAIRKAWQHQRSSPAPTSDFIYAEPTVLKEGEGKYPVRESFGRWIPAGAPGLGKRK